MTGLKPRLTIKKILAWADRHHRRRGQWPRATSGTVLGAPHENWAAINASLKKGCRGLPGGTSLAKRLKKHRGVLSGWHKPPLTVNQILVWAADHRKRTGAWPLIKAGAISKAPGENWQAIDHALRIGGRGFRGGSSLGELLYRYRGVASQKYKSRLTIKRILEWADEHKRRTGSWPLVRSGPVGEVFGMNWRKIDNALNLGLRGLSSGSSLARLLGRERGKWNRKDRPMLTVGKILKWADAHHRRSGRWPIIASGRIHGTLDDTWSAVNAALFVGTRGLPGGTSLAKLLSQRRNARNRKGLPRLTIKQILAWADAFHKRNRRRPTVRSGRIPRTVGETWCTVDKALSRGTRGLPGGSSLAQMLDKYGRRRKRYGV